jgi:hypothetical protein
MVVLQTNLKRSAPFGIIIDRTVGSRKNRTPPYYVTFDTGEAAWYDASHRIGGRLAPLAAESWASMYSLRSSTALARPAVVPTGT